MTKRPDQIVCRKIGHRFSRGHTGATDAGRECYIFEISQRRIDAGFTLKNVQTRTQILVGSKYGSQSVLIDEAARVSLGRGPPVGVLTRSWVRMAKPGQIAI